MTAKACFQRTASIFVLTIAGDGDQGYMASLQRTCEDLDLETSVTFMGYVADPFDIYARADAVLMCSRHEAMGRVTAEGMAAGRVVIGCNSGGTKELIQDRYDGLLYDGSIVDLVRCMRLCLTEHGLANTIATNAHNKAKNIFTNEECSRQVYNILSRISK